jgi:hypothetical protein
MPKTEIDYSNTIIYKITCNNKTVTDLYVGHTTNFVQRKHAHKQSSLNVNYKVKLYEVIRANGGWNNWKMEIINFFECKNHYEAREKEQEYFVSLNATLNSIEPLPTRKTIVLIKKPEKDIFFCNTCNIRCNSNNLLEEHNTSNKHIKKSKISEMNINPLIDVISKFSCNVCNIRCSRESEWNRHIHTRKHIVRAGGNDFNIKHDKESKEYICCNCNKHYNTHGGLWKHMKKCNNPTEHMETNPPQEDIKALTSLILELIKSNNELQKQMLEMCKNK